MLDEGGNVLNRQTLSGNYNTVMYDPTVSNCCIPGYHSASNNPSYSWQFA